MSNFLNKKKLKNNKASEIKAKNSINNNENYLSSENDECIKRALEVLTNLRTNIYQKLYYLSTTPPSKWRQFDFLSSKIKITNFIDKVEHEIKSVKEDNFNLEKYKPAIECILGAKNLKFNDAIVKNMYIAKLQNILFLLKENEENDGINETKNAKPDILR